MAGVDPEDADYVCTLTEASLKRAQEELNEVPSERLNAVKALRDWIKQQPHLNVPSDTKNLLRWLRVAKFSQLKARTLIDNLYTIQAERPHWFKDVDTADPLINKIINYGQFVTLGNDKDGRLVLLNRLGTIPAEVYKDPETKAAMFRANQAMHGLWMRDENVQVNGLVFFIDATNLTPKHQAGMSISDMKFASKIWKNAMPLRFKGQHIYNPGAVFEAILALAKPFMPKKFIDRMKIHGSNLESVYKDIPMEMLPDEYLPDDYKGPSAGPLKDIQDKFIKQIENPDYRNYILEYTSKKYGVDESKRPAHDPQLQASFRKLNVD